MKTAHFLQLIVLGALWGASFLFTRIAVPVLGPVWLVSARVLAGALFLLAAGAFLRRAVEVKGNLGHFFCLGLLNTALPFLLFSYAATALTASLLSIINSTAPLWGMLVGIVLTRQAPSWRVLGGLAAGLVGVAVLVLRDPAALAAKSALPVVAALVAPVCYGIASHYARLQTTHVSPMAVAHGSMWGAFLCLLPVVLVTPLPVPAAALDVGILASALALGVLCTGVAYQIYFRLVRDIGAASALTVTFLIPLFGILWGAVFLNEAINGSTFVGAAFVLLGTALVTGFNPLALSRQG
ncbi:MAG TPA: DMT family transporter [Accumulibacter sp.]|jgi:drug/metabolite transporter (DMT)-like permease|nr:DMT family transporter [Accumulibacter sp.]HQC80521.1 DMT family transporter [Accumulibacter sp.]